MIKLKLNQSLSTLRMRLLALSLSFTERVAGSKRMTLMVFKKVRKSLSEVMEKYS